ncbi:MAG: hypothetical protein HY457_00270 [Parcubacteria group bacterium]|nr:hypothetical protein [Parcubacteria group bacterium]
MKSPRNLLLFQSLLPVGMAVVYGVALSWSGDVFLYALFWIVLATAFATRAVMFTVIAAVVAISAFVGMSSVGEVTLDYWLAHDAFGVVAALIFAGFATSIARGNVRLKSGPTILFAHNILWTSAVGGAAYFGVTFWGIVALATAVALPLLLLYYESMEWDPYV